MTRYSVLVYVNVGEGNFFGYTAKAPLAKVGRFTVEALDPLDAAETMFAVGNKEVGPDAEGKEYPRDVRSISVGDLLSIGILGDQQTFYAVASVGWTEVPEPTNPIVPLEGTIATSRKV